MLRHISGLLLFCVSCIAHGAGANPQVLQLGNGYDFVLYANTTLADVKALPVQHAVILVHGIKRNAADYFSSGEQLLNNAGLTAADTLLLAPHFLTDADGIDDPKIPRWAPGQWLHGSPSFSGVPAFAVLDDLLNYLGDRQRFPALKDVLLVGHSAGGQLVQRYAIFNPTDTVLAKRGIHLRYGVASPSSYLYFDGQRQQPELQAACPGYNRYRYGLEKLPAYGTQQKLTAQQLFRRYAARDVVYLVGSEDNNPHSKVMDQSCAAHLQGPTRRQRQVQYLAYEKRLAEQWKVPLKRAHLDVEGVGHDQAALFARPEVAEALTQQSL